MTEAQTALARRAVACEGWRWMPGMRTLGNMRVIHDPYRWPDRPCAIREGTWVDTAVPRPLGDDLPDLTDPATVGCLLALVREAWSEPRTAVVPLSGDRWGVAIPNVLRQSPTHKGATEAEALVAALESAP